MNTVVNYSSRGRKSSDIELDGYKFCDDINFLNDPVGYVSGKSVAYKKILGHFINFRKSSWIRIRNEVLADHADCTKRQVIRITNALHSDGLVFKSQVNKFAPNDFVLHPIFLKGTTSFAYWFDGLTPSDQVLYMDHGIITKQAVPFRINDDYCVTQGETFRPFLKDDVIQNGSIYLIDNLFSTDTDIRAREGIRIRVKRERYRKEMVNKLCKSDVTPTMRFIVASFKLSKCEKLRLLAFPSNCLDDVYEKYIVLDKKLGWGWFLSEANDWCKNRDIRPNWRYFYELCQLYGVDADAEKVEAIKQKSLKRKESDSVSNKPYNPVRNKEAHRPYHDIKLSSLYEDLKKWNSIIEANDASGDWSNAFGGRTFVVRCRDNVKSEINERETTQNDSVEELHQYAMVTPDNNREIQNEICNFGGSDTASKTTIQYQKYLRQPETPQASRWNQSKKPTRIGTFLHGYATS